MKKVLLIKPPNDSFVNIDRDSVLPPLSPDMAVLSLGSFLKANGVPVELVDVQMDFGFCLDARAHESVMRNVVAYIESIKEDILWIGITLFCSSFSGLDLLGRICKTFDSVPIVLGGYFPSTACDALFESYPGVSGMVKGDGEDAALAISRTLLEGGRFPDANIPNLVWKNGGKVEINTSLKGDLARYPIMDFSLLKNGKSYSLVNMMTTRGCPFSCGYCLERKMRSFSSFSPDWVERQLENISRNTESLGIFIHDPLFTNGVERTTEICKLLGRAKRRFAIESRVDTLKPDFIPVLRDAGVELIYFGFESASPDTLIRMKKVPSRKRAESYVQDAFSNFKACFENGITIIAGIMFGYPGDAEDDYRKSLEFVKGVNAEYHDTAKRTGVQSGFLFSGIDTRIESASDLNKEVEDRYPEVVLQDIGDFMGEKRVVQPSRGVDLRMAHFYRDEMIKMSIRTYSPLAIDRFNTFIGLQVEETLKKNPCIVDGNGVFHFDRIS